MIYLLDSNVLIAACHDDHFHFESAHTWLQANPEFAVCPITEGALTRYVFRTSLDSSQVVKKMLEALSAQPGYRFWPDDVSYLNVPLKRISGHKQVTDAYLIALAALRGGRLATFDEALASIYPEAILIS